MILLVLNLNMYYVIPLLFLSDIHREWVCSVLESFRRKTKHKFKASITGQEV